MNRKQRRTTAKLGQSTGSPGASTAEAATAAALLQAGLKHQEAGRLAEAEAFYRRALAVQPNHADALYLLGVLAQRAGRADLAVEFFDQAIKSNKNSPPYFAQRARSLQALMRFDEALASYDRALALQPDHAETFNNRGIALGLMNRMTDALASFDRAIALKPNYAEALNNRAVAMRETNRLDDALASFDLALTFKPDDVQALSNRGSVLQELQRLDEALASYEKALALRPAHSDAFLGMLSCANALCDWDRMAALADQAIVHLTAKKCITAPFAILGYFGDPLFQLKCAENFVASMFPSLPQPICTGATWRHDRLRIAYLSADFRQHATAFLITELFELHDRSRFEIIAISSGMDDGSEARNRVVRACDRFIDVGSMSDDAIARLLHNEQIDIVVDLMGYSRGSRPGILARRPAPIQVSYLGYPGTMGAPFIDYIVGDRIVTPFEHQAFYTENIVHLPHSYQVNDTQRRIAGRAPTRHQAGLPDQGFVFCCFNQTYKITRDVFGAWMRLLQAVDGSTLWLLRDHDGTAQNLRGQAQKCGIDPLRLVFAGRMPPEDHLARHRLADLFLDTLPYNAHTTASDALWMGLPVVTQLGDAFAGRVAASLLDAIGLPELVTHNIEDYERVALQLAKDPALLDRYRNRLAANRTTQPLFDADRFRRHIEAAYLKMWEIRQCGGQPRAFAVDAEPAALPPIPSLLA
jgi:protein O-GlcNAc transferase